MGLVDDIRMIAGCIHPAKFRRNGESTVLSNIPFSRWEGDIVEIPRDKESIVNSNDGLGEHVGVVRAGVTRRIGGIDGVACIADTPCDAVRTLGGGPR